MKILQFSSLLFFTVVIHAFYLENVIYHHLSLLITLLSILTHSYDVTIYHNYIRNIDRIVAHFTYFYVVFIDTPIIIKIQPFIIFFPLSILNLWILEFIYPNKFILLHLMLHILSICSLHTYLYYLNII